MLTISELMGDEAEVDVPFGEKSLHITFRPGNLTAELEDEYVQRMADDRPVDALAKMVATLIVGWDVVDAKGKAVKPSYSFLRKLGVQTLTRILTAIQEASGLVRGAETTKNSGGGSSLAGN